MYEASLEEKIKQWEEIFQKEINNPIELEKEGQQLLEELYQKVSKRFGIKKGKISIKYDNILDGGFGIQLIDSNKYKKEKKLILEPKLIAGRKIFSYTTDQKKAVTAHEIGHYLNVKNLDKQSLEMFATFHMGKLLLDKGKLSLKEHEAKLLNDFHLKEEISADNHAIEKGYGKGLLSFFEEYGKDKTERIANIKEKLGKTKKQNIFQRLENLYYSYLY